LGREGFGPGKKGRSLRRREKRQEGRSLEKGGPGRGKGEKRSLGEKAGPEKGKRAWKAKGEKREFWNRGKKR